MQGDRRGVGTDAIFAMLGPGFSVIGNVLIWNNDALTLLKAGLFGNDFSVGGDVLIWNNDALSGLEAGLFSEGVAIDHLYVTKRMRRVHAVV